MAESQQPLRSHLLPFLDYCEIEKGLANNTQRNYRQYLRVFFAWLDKTHHADLRPRELTAKHVWDYRLYIARSYKTPAGRYLSRKSQNLYLMALRAFLRYLAERDIETFPSTKITLAKQKAEEPVSFLERQEVESDAQAAGYGQTRRSARPGDHGDALLVRHAHIGAGRLGRRAARAPDA